MNGKVKIKLVSILFLDSTLYSRHGNIAVNIPLACGKIFGPNICTNSRIHVIAIDYYYLYIHINIKLKQCETREIFTFIYLNKFISRLCMNNQYVYCVLHTH